MKIISYLEIFLLILLVGSFVSAQGLASSVTYQPKASFQSVYGSEDRFRTYWPILGDQQQCKERQDLLLQVAPAGCQPSVVRSDLLAEQDVPVFCQIDALQVDPLIDIDQIRSITFTGKYPKEVATAGYHPARAALRSRDRLLGSPLINNIGYVVVVLKRNEKEKELPDFVSVNMTGRLSYESGNAYGIGRAEFLLEPISDKDWESSEKRFRQSFWNGKYFVRLEKAEPSYVIISLYSGERKVTTQRVEKGKTSDPVWVPGAYCRAGIRVAFDDFVGDQDRALIEISDGEGTDRIDVYQGSRILNDKCSVSNVNVNEDKTGSVTIRCSGNEGLVLSFGGKKLSLDGISFELASEYKEGAQEENTVFYSIGGANKGSIGVSLKGNKVYLYEVEIGSVSDKKITIDKTKLEMAIQDKISSLSDVKKELKIGDEAKLVEFFMLAFNEATIEGKKITPQKADKKSNEADEAEKELNKALADLEKVADEYPAEKVDPIGNDKWGEKSLTRAIELAGKAKKFDVRERLMRKFIELYPEKKERYLFEFNNMENFDVSDSVGVIDLDNRYWNIRLIDFKRPSKKSSATFAVTGSNIEKISVEEKMSREISDKVGFLRGIRLDNVIDEETVSVTVTCKEGGDKGDKSSSMRLKIGEDSKAVCSQSSIKLDDVKLEKVAKVRLLPEAQGTETVTNLSVKIGIEKRAIKLSTEKTEEMIDNLNKSIKKWENINNKLGEVVKGLKGACFATAAVMTVKNFLTGIDGEAIARTKVMQGEHGWTRRCADIVSKGESVSLDECYYKNRDKIGNDVSKAKEIINDINEKIKKIEDGYPLEGTGFLGTGEKVDKAAAAVDYCKELLKNEKYANANIKTIAGDKSLRGLITNCDKAYNTDGIYGYTELRDIEFNLRMREAGVSEDIKKNYEVDLESSYNNLWQNSEGARKKDENDALASKGIPPAYDVNSKYSRINIYPKVVPVGSVNQDAKPTGLSSSHFATISVDSSLKSPDSGDSNKGFGAGVYYLGLKDSPDGTYSIEQIFEKQDSGYVEIKDDRKSEFLDVYKIGRVTSAESVNYNNPYENPEVRFYESEPYKGMPAIVPFDVKNGWYAATRQTLPSFGGIGSFDASGRVTSFWLCNVGENKREQFFEGSGDDICQLINLNTGQPLGFFPGLSEVEARQKVGQAIQAIQDASNQFGKKFVRVKGVGRDLAVGNPAANIPSTQCQNFMSPEDCHILFNVCDPVICPSSRCDFGGKYPVADVVQTGIIGSTLLCLPNFKEGIIVPVCLTGIHAGIEGYLSILQAHRDCLQENLDSGKMIGICDQIYSVYLCEFFWRQIAPVAKVILPKIVEFAYGGGQGSRGGGEYLSVMSAWNNMQNSIDYFTQSYAANSIKAYGIRSVEEAGTPICKSFISAKVPTSFDALVEPDSPAQFHAWFSSTRFTDTTVPATSQYKVFYHIFAGKDRGAYFNIYLKNPPEESYYNIPAIVNVASGFVGKGKFVEESKDFTAPEGYKELCVRVNDQEECGFKEVSTSFALNYLKDSYVSDELGEKDIKTEKECISGSPNLKAAILTPNIGAGAEEAALPQAYQRGIVRICSSNNPGSQTDPTRFVQVGYCTDQKIKCWLDKESVKNAISDNNAGLRNETLSEIDKTQRADLISKGLLKSDDQAVAGIKELTKKIDNKFRAKSDGIDLSEYRVTLGELDSLLAQVVLNHHKANILYLIGDLETIKVEKGLDKAAAEKAKEGGAGAGAGGGVGGGSSGTSSGSGGLTVVSSPGDLEKAIVRVLAGDSKEGSTIKNVQSGNGFYVKLKNGKLGALTNHHVVHDNSFLDNSIIKKIIVVIEGAGNSQNFDSKFIKTSNYGKDVALINADGAKNRFIVKLGDSNAVRVEDSLQVLSRKSESGEITSINVNVVEIVREDDIEKFKFSPKASGGFSGSPVFNNNNEVVGIISQEERIIPINVAKELFKDELDLSEGSTSSVQKEKYYTLIQQKVSVGDSELKSWFIDTDYESLNIFFLDAKPNNLGIALPGKVEFVGEVNKETNKVVVDFDKVLALNLGFGINGPLSDINGKNFDDLFEGGVKMSQEVVNYFEDKKKGIN